MTTYTPALSGTGWALGDGVVTGRWMQVGKRVDFYVHVLFESTSTFGSGALAVSIPVPRLALSGGPQSMPLRMTDFSELAFYFGWARIINAGTTALLDTFVAGTPGQVTINGSYEAA